VAASLGPVVGTSISAGGGTAPAQALSGSSSGGLIGATIRRTSHGIPHILASDYAGLGFGYAYAFAQDNLCVLANEYVTVNGERSRYFGPDASYTQGGNGASQTNLNSDFFFQRIKDRGTIEELLALAPPRGPRPEIKEAVRGFVAGYNKYLRETGVDNLPDPGCRGKPWVREITEMDVYRRFYQLGLIASQGVAIQGIGAQPPVGAGPPPPTSEERDRMLAELKQKLPFGDVGSNAYGLGKDATDNGKGMMLGNPHFPWDGSERFYEAQLTIPGQVNVEGASLFGVPVINIGHTDKLAWSHTVSTAYRFTPFELKLVPGSPTSYIYDGQVRQMRAEDVTVLVKNADGTLSPRTRTLYSSHHGSILTEILGLPLFPWTPASAFAMGDANATNFRYLNHFFEVNQAQSVDELQDIINRNQGVPWVNTLAADSTGKAFYADISVTPHVTDEEAAACNTEVGRAAFAALGLPVLDGSLSTCEWASDAFGGPDPDAIEPGIFGPSHMPKLIRDDYVTNSNDSYWLSNPEEPLTGFDRIIGDEETERSLRTRSGLVMVEERLNGTDGRPGNRFTLKQLQDTVFANRQYAGELWRDELADFCEANPTMSGSNGPVDVSAACPVLRAWDLHDNLDSNGAILFRRFASLALNAVPVTGTPGLFTQQFDANDGVHTPSGLNVANPAVEQSFADAVQDLRDAGIPLDAPLRGWQYERRGSEKIPIHGGPGGVGVFNAINVQWVGSGANPGYPNVPHGSSFVMAAQFTDDGCPVDTRTILTYSQSSNPDSPYFADQTRMFSNKEWVDEAYCEEEIQADPNLQVTTIESTPYARPVGASPIRMSLVPAFEPCDEAHANAVHQGPLVGASCSSPVPSSSDVAVGPRSLAFARYRVLGQNECAPSPTGACYPDVVIAGSATDVRSGGVTGPDYDTTAPNGHDLTLTATLPGSPQGEGVAITDLQNRPDSDPSGAFDQAATVVPLSFPIPVNCTPTSDPGIGSACAVQTTFNTLVPGSAVLGARAVWELGQFQLLDQGADGAPGNADDRRFEVQGVFVP
jgi:acyl-homoserine-lactone acylase